MRKLKTASLLELMSLKGGSLQRSAPYLNPLRQNKNAISPTFLQDEGSLLWGGSLCPPKLPGCPSPGVSSPWSLSHSRPFCLSCVSKWQLAKPPTGGKTPLEPVLEPWASHQASGGGGASPGLLSGPAAGELGGALAGRGEASPASPSVLDSPCLSLTESLQCRAFAPILKTRRMRFVKID